MSPVGPYVTRSVGNVKSRIQLAETADKPDKPSGSQARVIDGAGHWVLVPVSASTCGLGTVKLSWLWCFQSPELYNGQLIRSPARNFSAIDGVVLMRPPRETCGCWA